MKKLAVLTLVVGSTASADRRVEVGAALGGHAFSGNGELGVDDVMTQPGPVSSVALGARAAFIVLPRLAVEGEAIAIPTKDDVAGDSALALGMRAHARFDLLTGRLRPFVLGGVGMHLLRPSSPERGMTSDADQSYHWGGGVRWAMNDAIDLRFDARHLIVPDRTLDGATSDFEITAGVMYRFGAKAAQPATRAIVAARPTPTATVTELDDPKDKDFDGIADAVDKCVADPEDVDTFEDDDGCPELDNDADKVADADDICPTDKETHNNYRDGDGCPDQVIGALAGIAFEQDSAKLDANADAQIQRAYDQLVEFPGLFVEIAGHTSGSETNKLDLSIKRAEAVKAALLKRGISASRILTVGHGSDVPAARNDTDDNRRKNRRIEFRLMTPDQVPL